MITVVMITLGLSYLVVTSMLAFLLPCESETD